MKNKTIVQGTYTCSTPFEQNQGMKRDIIKQLLCVLFVGNDHFIFMTKVTLISYEMSSFIPVLLRLNSMFIALKKVTAMQKWKS